MLKALASLTALSLAAAASCPSVTTVDIDMAKFPGRWYEVASANLGVTDGCECTYYDYTMTGANTYDDRFSCRKNGKNDALDFTAKGQIPDLNHAGIQKESPISTWLPSAPYLVVEVADDYSYSVVYSCVNLYVTAPLQYTYIFHRERDGLSKIDLEGIKQRLVAQGVDVSLIKAVPQDNCDGESIILNQLS